MFEKRKRQKAVKRRLNEAIAREWAARGVIPTGHGPQSLREALRKAGLPDVGSSEYTRIVREVMEDAVSSLSSEDRALVTGSSAARSEEESAEEATSRDEYPVMTQLLGESFLNEWKTSLIRERERRQAIEDELKRQIMIDLADRPEEWAAELDRRMARLYEDEDHEEGRATEEGRIRMNAVTAEERLDDEQIELAAAVEILTGADDRVDLYGMGEEEADLYLRTHYSQVVAHDTLRLSVLVSLIEQGGAEEIAGGYVRFTDDDAVALLRKMARGRSLNPLRSLRPHRHFAKSLLREWKDAGKVRLSVLSSMPRTLAAEDYHGQVTGAVSWDAEGKATFAFGPDADPGTFITSMALFFRRVLSPEQERAAERAFGIRAGIWRPEDEQRYARAYLRWVSEGNAPIPELREAFEVFNKMATPEMLDVELTDEMRAVFRTTMDYTGT